MDMKTIGYFLYMEECERLEEQKQKEKEECAAGEYKVNSNSDLVAERATHTKIKIRF